MYRLGSSGMAMMGAHQDYDYPGDVAKMDRPGSSGMPSPSSSDKRAAMKEREASWSSGQYVTHQLLTNVKVERDDAVLDPNPMMPLDAVLPLDCGIAHNSWDSVTPRREELPLYGGRAEGIYEGFPVMLTGSPGVTTHTDLCIDLGLGQCQEEPLLLRSPPNVSIDARLGRWQEEPIVLESHPEVAIDTATDTRLGRCQEEPILLDSYPNLSIETRLGRCQEEPILLDDDSDDDFCLEEEDARDDDEVATTPLEGRFDNSDEFCLAAEDSKDGVKILAASDVQSNCQETRYIAGWQPLVLRQLEQRRYPSKVGEESAGAPACAPDAAKRCHESNDLENEGGNKSKRMRSSEYDYCSSNCSEAPLEKRTESSCGRNDGYPDRDQSHAISKVKEEPHNESNAASRFTEDQQKAFADIFRMLGKPLPSPMPALPPATADYADDIDRGDASISSTKHQNWPVRSSGSGTADVVLYDPKPEPIQTWPATTSTTLFEVKQEVQQSEAMVGSAVTYPAEEDAETALVAHMKGREAILAALDTFEQVRLQILKNPSYGQTEHSPDGLSSKRVRADLKAACMMRKRNFWLNEMERPIGHVPGVAVGDRFKYRIEMAIIGLHRAVQAGIATIPVKYSPHGQTLASSVVIGVSDPYHDDHDMGDTVIYSGQGGLCGKTKESQDQQLKRGNLALYNSFKLKEPVRLIRGHKGNDGPTSVSYSYDGLYKITEMKYVNGKNGKKVYTFTMKRLPGQEPIPLGSPSSTQPGSAAPLCLESTQQAHLCFEARQQASPLPLPLENAVH